MNLLYRTICIVPFFLLPALVSVPAGAFRVLEPRATEDMAFCAGEALSQWLKGDFTHIIPGDFNGDGKTDFIRQERGEWAVNDLHTAQVFYSADGKGSFTGFEMNRNRDPSSQWGYLEEPFSKLLKGDLIKIIPGDFNGDGMTDFIRQQKDEGRAQVFYSDGENGRFTVEIIQYDPTGRGYSWGFRPYAYLNGEWAEIIPGDFNGDGRIDFIRQEKGLWDNDDVATSQVFYSLGKDGKFRVIPVMAVDAPYGWGKGVWNHLKGDWTNLIIGDFNGDGKDDFIRQEKGTLALDGKQNAQVFYSTGSEGKFTVRPVLNENVSRWLGGDVTTITVADFDGDGRDDIIRQEKAHWDNDERETAQIFYAGGKTDGLFIRYDIRADQDPYGWKQQAWQYLKGDATRLIVGDFDGDGRADFIRQEKGEWGKDDTTTSQIFYASERRGRFHVKEISAREDPYGWKEKAWQYLKGDLTNLIVGDFDGDGRADFIRQEKAEWDDDDKQTAQVFYAVPEEKKGKEEIEKRK